jgi:DNA-directed RNA polymerase III subunit RPC8
VGVCICLWDVLNASDGLITGGDSSVYVESMLLLLLHRALLIVTVTFRVVVFRPFRGEILQASVVDINQDGIRRESSGIPNLTDA